MHRGDGSNPTGNSPCSLLLVLIIFLAGREQGLDNEYIERLLCDVYHSFSLQ